MTTFADIPEQAEAKRLLEAALTEGSAHAYLFHGPAGVGKRQAARAFAGALLDDPRRVDGRIHPDLHVTEALGAMIRIDEIRALHHDLHLRPFEADRRVYLILDADRMNDDAAAALLKDLEEPPAYATIVLVADELGKLPDTIRSRCQLVPFRRLSRAAVEEWVAARAPDLEGSDVAVVARMAGGRLDRAARQLDDDARARRDALLDAARGVYADERFDPAAAAAVILDGARSLGTDARRREQELVDRLELPARDAEQRVRRAEFGAEKAEVLATLDDLAAWYRDLVVAASGAEETVAHADRLAVLRDDAAGPAGQGAEEAASVVRQGWREIEELNLNLPLFLEALFVRLRLVFS